MNVLIELKDVFFTYPNRSRPALDGVSLQINAGEFVLLTGASGCGKSTLLKLLNGLIPQESGGSLQGEVVINGVEANSRSIGDLSCIVGMVFQSPDDQIFSATLFDEVSFVLENLGLPPPLIEKRTREALAAVDLGEREADSIHDLSGGQKQRLAVAAVLAARPKILALDEPISQLDPVNADRLLRLLTRLNEEYGITILMVEHRLHEAVKVCGRAVVMNEGRIAGDRPMAEALANPKFFSDYGLRIPQLIDICGRLALHLPRDDMELAARLINGRYAPLACSASRPERTEIKAVSADGVIIRGLNFSYAPQRPVLQDIDLRVGGGQIVALMGTNGAGKSTLLMHIAGILTARSGVVGVDGQFSIAPGTVGLVMQNPDMMLFNKTVYDEIAFAPRQMGVARQRIEAQCRDLMRRLAITELCDDFPLGLSRGQRLRVAIAAVLALEPKVLLLDEPTTGQDISRIADILSVVRGFAAAGGAVVFCTHDTEVAAAFAGRIVVMEQGRIIADGAPREVFADAALLLRAGLKQPPASALSQKLGAGTLVAVEEVVDYVRQAATRRYAV